MTRFSSILAIKQIFQTGRYFFTLLRSGYIFLTPSVTIADLLHCCQMPDASNEMNGSVREGRMNENISLINWKGSDLGHMT